MTHHLLCLYSQCVYSHLAQLIGRLEQLQDCVVYSRSERA